MYIHEMIGETKKLRQQMTAENESYFGEMVMYFRSGASSLTEAKGEEILLSLARQIVKNQDKGVSATDLFGDDSKAYCAQLADDVLTGTPRSLKDKIIYYTMIPWVALTWVFFIYMITGFFSKWFGGELEYTLISSSSLLIIAGLSIVLVELVTRFLGPGRTRAAGSPEPVEPAESPEPSGHRRFDLKTLGIYIGGAVLLIAFGTLLNRIMPAFTVSPWNSLIIFVIGLAGQIVLLRVRSKA